MGAAATATSAAALSTGPFSELALTSDGRSPVFAHALRKPWPIERKSTIYERMIHGDPSSAPSSSTLRRSRSSVDMMPWHQAASSPHSRRAVTQKVLGSSRRMIASSLLQHDIPYVADGGGGAATSFGVCRHHAHAYRHGAVLPQENGHLATDEQPMTERGSITSLMTSSLTLTHPRAAALA